MRSRSRKKRLRACFRDRDRASGTAPPPMPRGCIPEETGEAAGRGETPRRRFARAGGTRAAAGGRRRRPRPLSSSSRIGVWHHQGNRGRMTSIIKSENSATPGVVSGVRQLLDRAPRQRSLPRADRHWRGRVRPLPRREEGGAPDGRGLRPPAYSIRPRTSPGGDEEAAAFDKEQGDECN